MKINCYSSYQMASNSYLVYDEESKQGFLVDAGCPAEKLIEEIDRLGISVQAVLFTHGHFDHIVGASGLQKRGYPLYIGEKDAPMLSSDKASMGAYFGFSTESAKADVLLKGGEELWLDDAHEACENDGINARRLQELDAAVLPRALQLRLPRCAVEVTARYAVPLRAVEDLRVGHVRQDKSYVRIERSSLYRVHDRLHVRARAGPENSKM